MPLSITVHANRSVTRYERSGRRRCMSIGGALEGFVVGASELELGPSGRKRLRNGKDLGEVEISE